MWFVALLLYLLGAINTYKAARDMRDISFKQCIIAGILWPILSIVNLWENLNAE